MNHGAMLLEARRVTKRFPLPEGDGEYTVLHEVDLVVREDEIVALLGKSGSGKSTLLRILSGLMLPSTGEVRYRGNPLAGPCAGTAMVFQTFALLPWLDVLGNVELGLKAWGIPPDVRRPKALRMIDVIGLDGHESAYPRELSGGMRQRVGFARALVLEPDVLLMDEPFSALDVLTAENLRGELLDLWLGRHFPTRAILIVTHNIEEAVLLADRVIVLGANPGHVRAEVPINLPRPRRHERPEVQALVDRFYQLLTRPETPDEARRVMPVRPALPQLPLIRVGTLGGLVEILADRGGRVDLHRLADDLQFDVDDLLPLLEAATLLGLARVEEADAILTQEGVRFAQASILERKEHFQQLLVAHPTIITRIHAALAAKANHRLPKAFFEDVLEEHFSGKEAERQLDTAIQWARFAELFSYDADTEELFLEREVVKEAEDSARQTASH
ncbi:MAG TPA: nitrate/sulfonate/bicarbonate ABC transporter ATP-binding protein [Candidatus Baltobacteraceae bacterium]|nr:nitrate/sulfonate/bicarbonate ABC transporter ATP-binding protein [Candidatus Baltobacteraceae bacterium]